MSLPTEQLLQMHEHLPMAAGMAGTGIDARIALVVAAAAASIATMGVNARRITPHLHENIQGPERGVLFYDGDPVQKQIAKPFKGMGHVIMPNHLGRVPLQFMSLELVPAPLRRFQHRWRPRSGHFVTYEQLDAGEGCIVILPPGWYFIGRYCSVEKVNTAYQPGGEIKIQKDARDGRSVKQLDFHAEFEWRIRPDGDHPYLAIDEIAHDMKNKKATEEDNTKREEKNTATKAQLATSIKVEAFRQAVGTLDLTAEEWLNLSKENEDKLKTATSDFSGRELAKFGLGSGNLRVLQVKRVDGEVIGDSFGKYSTPPDTAAAMSSTREQQDGQADAETGKGNRVVIPGPWPGSPKPAA